MRNNLLFAPWLRLSLMCLLVVLFATTLLAQKFAFVSQRQSTAEPEAITGYKFRVAQKIYLELANARGDKRMLMPTFVMNNGNSNGAWMDPIHQEIGLEEKAYDVCIGTGPDSLNAIAALLAHELTHYYEKHDWTRSFAAEHIKLDSTDKITHLDEGLKLEAQADYIGGFLAYSAGYNTLGVMPQLLPALYKAYGLKPNIQGYPSLQDRIKMAQSSSKKLQDLQIVFETAFYLSMVEKHEQAAKYYNFILQTYQSREIYNNMGVNLSLAAMKLLSKKELPYVLPIELDPNSRLTQTKDVQEDRIEKIKNLLAQAQLYFDQSLILDPKYTTAYLNKAVVFGLQAEWEDARYYLSKGQKLCAGAPEESNFWVMEGILDAFQGNTANAEALFEKAASANNDFGTVNLNILQGTQRDIEVPQEAKGRETIDGILLKDYLGEPQPKKEIKLNETITCGLDSTAFSTILIDYVAGPAPSLFVLQRTNSNYTGATSRGLHVGATREDVYDTYGSPVRRVALPNGNAVWVYFQWNTLFKFDNNGLTSWAIFAQDSQN